MLVAPLKRSTRSASLPVCPSRVKVFIRFRVPEMLGVAVPKVSPSAALSVLALTPGITRSSATMSRPFDPSCSICREESSPEFSELDVWTWTVSARTDTDSATEATSSRILPRARRSVAVRMTPVRSVGLNPSSSTRTA